MLHELGLIDLSGRLPGSLSSGQRRRLALAGAFVRPRKLLVLDEPEQRLDAAGVAWLGERIAKEKRDGLAVVIASHSPALVERMLGKLHALVREEIGEERAPFDLDMFGTREVKYRKEDNDTAPARDGDRRAAGAD